MSCRRAVLLLGACLSLLLVTGCSSAKREECRTLLTLLNTGADRFEKAQASQLDPAGLKALADVLEKTAGEAEALKLTTPELQKHSTDYSTLVRDVARTARDMAAAGAASDLEKAKAANTVMEKLVGDEPRLMAEVNKVCAAQ